MKRGVCFTLVAFLLGIGFVLSTAQAVTYNTGFQVKNMSDVAVANINIRYFNQDGTEAITAVPDTIPAAGSKTYFPIHPTTTFNGSVVIESDQPIAAIANTLGDGTQYGASTNGFTAGATTINLPLLMKANAGFNTWFNVQNTGAVAATVNVTYSNGAVEPAASVPPGASKTYDQAVHAGLPNGFVGSATVTSDQPVVATVMQVGAGGIKVLLGYNSFSGGSTEIQLPLIMANNAGFFTGIQVMNTGTVPTNITITYGPNTVAGGATPAPDVFNGVAAGTSVTKLNNTFPTRYVGGATVTNSAGQPLVAIVNQLSAAGKGTAYEGINPTGVTASAVAPLIMANNGGFFTGVQVQNVGTAPCDVTVQYSPNTVVSAIATPTPDTVLALAPGSSMTFLQNGGQWTARYIGGATINGTGAGCLVSAIVNELNAGVAGDQFFTYNTASK